MSRYNYTEYETTLHPRSKILLILHETLVWPYMTHTFGVWQFGTSAPPPYRNAHITLNAYLKKFQFICPFRNTVLLRTRLSACISVSLSMFFSFCQPLSFLYMCESMFVSAGVLSMFVSLSSCLPVSLSNSLTLSPTSLLPSSLPHSPSQPPSLSLPISPSLCLGTQVLQHWVTTNARSTLYTGHSQRYRPYNGHEWRPASVQSAGLHCRVERGNSSSITTLASA